MNKLNKIILFSVILSIGIVMTIFSLSDSQTTLKQVPCVDGANHLISNLPRGIICKRIVPVLFGSSKLMITFQIINGLVLAVGLIGFFDVFLLSPWSLEDSK